MNAILEALADSDGLSERRLEETVNLRQGQIEKVLKFLSVDNPAPVLKDGPKWLRTPVPYDMDHERIQRLTHQRAQEWQEVQEYIDTPDCLMVFLARSLDDENPRPCGKCARCLGRPVIDEGFSHRLAVDASLYLRRSDLPLEGKKQVATGAFPTYGFKGNLPEGLRAETGRILSRWGDAGWGRLVAEDHAAGHFRDELVDAVAGDGPGSLAPGTASCLGDLRPLAAGIRSWFPTSPGAWRDGLGCPSWTRSGRCSTTRRKSSSRTAFISVTTSTAPSK